MKRIYNAILGICCISISNCQEIAERDYELHAVIVDDAGNPVPMALVYGARQELLKDSPVPLTKNIQVKALSGMDGTAILKFKSIPTPAGVAIERQEFYPSFYSVIWKPRGTQEAGSWIAEISALLKPVKCPVPMNAARMTGDKVIVIPELNKDYGYDLQMAGMVEPLGIGKRPDLIIRVEGEYKDNNGRKSKITATVRLTDPNDGLVYFGTPEREKGSSFLGNYLAPENGYLKSLTIPFDSSEKAKNISRKNEGNYYFRVRTVRDENGHIISSNYGKIHGDFMLWSLPLEQGGVAQISWIASYFNPTPNDRNVEFDTKRNLTPKGNVQKP